MQNIRSQNWYLAQVKPNCSAIAQRNLERQGFDCFCPLERCTRRQGGRFVSTTRPYFPGYLFISIASGATPWRAIRSTYGVANLVCFGERPIKVPQAIVEDFREACDHQGCMKPAAAIAEGDKVRIAEGPLVSFVGRVDGIALGERAWVLIDIIGKATRASLKQADLRVEG